MCPTKSFPHLFLPPSIVIPFTFFHSRLYLANDFSTSAKISTLVVFPCMLCIDANSSIISNLYSCDKQQSTDVSNTSVDCSLSTANLSNSHALSFSCHTFLPRFFTLRAMLFAEKLVAENAMTFSGDISFATFVGNFFFKVHHL